MDICTHTTSRLGACPSEETDLRNGQKLLDIDCIQVILYSLDMTLPKEVVLATVVL